MQTPASLSHCPLLKALVRHMSMDPGFPLQGSDPRSPKPCQPPTTPKTQSSSSAQRSSYRRAASTRRTAGAMITLARPASIATSTFTLKFADWYCKHPFERMTLFSGGDKRHPGLRCSAQPPPDAYAVGSATNSEPSALHSLSPTTQHKAAISGSFGRLDAGVGVGSFGLGSLPR